MKTMSCLLYILILLSTSYAQLDGLSCELFTHTAGSSADTIRFWMLAQDAVWHQDFEPDSMLDQRLTSLFDSAHATDADFVAKGVPVPHSSNAYGIFSVLSGYSGYYIDRAYGFGKYKLLIGEEFNDPEMYFYIDFTDCDYTKNYVDKDFWMRYNTDSNFCEISWEDGNFNNPTVVEQNEHPTFEIWDYKDKKTGHSGQNTSYLELYLTVSTQNDHPYLSWNAYDERGGNNNVDYYEIWKKKDSSWYEKDTTSNTYYEDTSEDATLPGVKKYAYYKIRAIELDEDESLFGNQVKKAVYEAREEGKAFLENESSIISNGNKPTKYSLKQNYPNPFNPKTTISFDLPSESNVQIQIYNIQGKVISTLINKKMGAGSHSIGFTSSGLTSGVYFYRLQTNEFTDIKRMLILK